MVLSLHVNETRNADNTTESLAYLEEFLETQKGVQGRLHDGSLLRVSVFMGNTMVAYFKKRQIPQRLPTILSDGGLTETRAWFGEEVGPLRPHIQVSPTLPVPTRNTDLAPPGVPHTTLNQEQGVELV